MFVNNLDGTKKQHKTIKSEGNEQSLVTFPLGSYLVWMAS